jgi:integrase
MARRPSVRHWASRGGYCCWYQGSQHTLALGPDDAPAGPTYLAALSAFRDLMEKGAVREAGPDNTVAAVIEAYMERGTTRSCDTTVETRSSRFVRVLRHLGNRKVGTLDKLAWEEFARTRLSDWADSTLCSFYAELSRVFNWAVKARLIPANPLRGVERPRSSSRGPFCVLSPAECARVRDGCCGASLRWLVEGLENTAARPGELVAATAADWDDAVGGLVYRADDRRREDEFRHKTAGRGRDRVIYFSGACLERVRSRVAQARPGDPLFPTRRGRRYGTKSVQSCFRELKERLKMPHLIAYSYRHTFATRWLLAGKSIDVLAELLGNTPATIRRHYGHLCVDRAALRRQLEDFKASGGSD